MDHATIDRPPRDVAGPAPDTAPAVNPALVGIWLLPGEPQTYEITATGRYFIAEPDAPVAFDMSGAVMIWGGRRYLRIEGAGRTPLGCWCEQASGDAWEFTPDHGISILPARSGRGGMGAQGEAGDGTLSGIWALRDGGTRLWCCEESARIATDGTHLTFETAEGVRLRCGYAVEDDRLVLLDPETSARMACYLKAARLIEAAAGDGPPFTNAGCRPRP